MMIKLSIVLVTAEERIREIYDHFFRRVYQHFAISLVVENYEEHFLTYLYNHSSYETK